MATTELTCARHPNTPTQLACAQCETPACTRCLVWTEVGQKCRNCVRERSRSSGSRRSLLVAVAAMVAVVVGAIVLLGGDDTTDLPRSANSGLSQAGIGQPARDGAITFVVASFECGPTELGTGPGKRTALGRFCMLNLNAANTGRQPAVFIPSQQFLLDGQRRRFGADAAATALFSRESGGTGSTATQQLNPGTDVDAVLVFDVNEGITPELAELHAGRGLGVTVRLGEGGA